MINIKWKLMTPTATLPKPGRLGDVGFDICCDESFVLLHGETRKISTGVQLAYMDNTDSNGNDIFIKVEGRSGLSAKGIFPIGGIVDPTYSGEVFVVLTNNGPDVLFHQGNRIAQLVVYKVATSRDIEMEITDTVAQTVRNDAGFGSSGV